MRHDEKFLWTFQRNGKTEQFHTIYNFSADASETFPSGKLTRSYSKTIKLKIQPENKTLISQSVNINLTHVPSHQDRGMLMKREKYSI